jgi:hypothetical protein
VQAQSAAKPSPSDPWISYPSANVTDYGVYHFRRSFALDRVPATLWVQVSGDNRYELFVNGQRVCYGPAKGDLKTYKYDEVDIAPYLKQGHNLLAAQVYNGGEDKPLAFITYQTAFLLRTVDPEYDFLNTDHRWKCFKNAAYDQITYEELKTWEWVRGFYACGGGDEVDAAQYPWGWEQSVYNDSAWLVSEPLTFEGQAPWHLVPRNIAFMEDTRQYPGRIRRMSGVETAANDVLLVPAHTEAVLIYDFDIFTMGYPELVLSDGDGASVKIKYAEALYDAPDLKAHRDSVASKTMYGVFDIYHADGGRKRMFRPLWKRAFRYIALEIKTAEQPLAIHSLVNEYSGYPYTDMSTFQSDDPSLNAIFAMCLQTLRMCSAETYYDTPYYEQLSYGGDNRPIGAMSMYNAIDDRLFREVMRLYPQSANPETKLFKSAYPSRFTFDNGTWSMAWVQSLKDYHWMRGDSAWVRQFVGDIEGVLTFYARSIDETVQLLGPLDQRNFIDWSIHYGSVPQRKPKITITHSAMLTLQYVHTLDCAVSLYRALGEDEKALAWSALADTLRAAVYRQCWNEEKQMFADYPAKETYSQHTNVLAILCNVLPDEGQKALMHRILYADGWDEVASSYFQFFVFKAMEKTGYEDDLLKHFDHWKMFLARGSTTCGETGFESHDRSDCHAWSAHPAYYLLRNVCGIRPAGVGFTEVLIEPHLGYLEQIAASMPHPSGRIQVTYSKKGKQLTAHIVLPEGLSGTWQYQGKTQRLTPGSNKIVQRSNH